MIHSYMSNYSMMAISLITILVLVGGVLYYTNHYRKDGFTSSSSSSSSSSSKGDVDVLFFFTDWCPHCKTAKPEWESVKSNMDGGTVNGYSINFKDINCTTETPEVEQLMSTHKVEGYPTIKMIKNGEVIEYDAKPNRDTLTEFINTILK